ncbi:MAG: DNA polymerase III subunit delta [Erysipelotrichaceae bacterium]|jgi:DNA polymerase-3 subunit delta|nr:DNA polymerase III subunit delta [Erysipelotrichaceae bacterium]
MNYFLYGEETYLLVQRQQEIIRGILGEDPDFSVLLYDCNQADFSLRNLLDDANTLPLFGEQKVIVLSNCSFVTAKGSISDADVALLTQYLKQPYDQTVLIFTLENGDIDRRKKVTKLLLDQCQSHSFERLKPWQLQNTAAQLIKAAKLKLTPQALQILNERLPGDLTTLHNEIEKLKNYPGELDANTIEVLIRKPLEENAFALVNALSAKDLKAVLNSYNSLLNNRDPSQLIALIASQFRVVFESLVLFERGYHPEQIASELNQNSYRIQKALEAGRNSSKERVLELLAALSRFDTQSKAGLMPKQLGFELFLIQATR